MIQKDVQDMLLQDLALRLLVATELFEESQRDPEDGTHDPYYQALQHLEWLETEYRSDYAKILGHISKELSKAHYSLNVTKLEVDPTTGERYE